MDDPLDPPRIGDVVQRTARQYDEVRYHLRPHRAGRRHRER
jgi:hypothetical protein